jgi:hypothetical protein
MARERWVVLVDMPDSEHDGYVKLIEDDARRGMVLGGQIPPRWPKRTMKTRNTRLAPTGGTP